MSQKPPKVQSIKLQSVLGIIKGVWSWRCSKSLRKMFSFCWAHCPLKALSLRPHRTCPNYLECTKVRDYSDKLTPNNCPSILKSTSLSYWKGQSNKVCPQGFHKILGNSLARMDRVPRAKIPYSQRIEWNYQMLQKFIWGWAS
jgi:hypothetical protein